MSSSPAHHCAHTHTHTHTHADAGIHYGRLLVISHPAIVNVNQEVYRELSKRGWDVTIVTPDRWRHAYSRTDVTPLALPGLEGALRPTRTALPGHPQRYFHLTNPRRLCRDARPDVAFIEAEPYSLVATQWSLALSSLGMPYGVQCYENIDRALPAPVRRLRARVLRQAAFVAARSDSAARLARAWGAAGEVGFAPPAVPDWETPPHPEPHAVAVAVAEPSRDPHAVVVEERFGPLSWSQWQSERPFTIGYAGRLTASKGLDDLLAAVRGLDAPVRLLLIGGGELRDRLARQPIPGSHVQVLDGLTHDQMPTAYARLDVLVLPSRTTPTWKEQLGRAIVEALSCGVPVVGSDSGEIPWLIELTGGGLVFAEGDRKQLAARLTELRRSPELRLRLAARGRARVRELFSTPAAADRLEGMLARAAGVSGLAEPSPAHTGGAAGR